MSMGILFYIVKYAQKINNVVKNHLTNSTHTENFKKNQDVNIMENKTNKFKKEIDILIRARYPIIYIDSQEKHKEKFEILRTWGRNNCLSASGSKKQEGTKARNLEFKGAV